MRAYKTEINPTAEQKQKIHQTIGVCRFVYNFYIAHNKDVYEKQKRFVSGMDFSKWLNNEFIPNNPDKSWIKDVGSKAVKQSIMNGEKAFKSFFDGKSKFPRFKKKNKQDVKAYFPKNNKTDWTVERHRIKMPTLGFVALKEKGYIPTNAKVKSGTFSYKAGRYYVSVLVEEDIKILNNNINKTKKVKELEKKLKREQRKLSRKYESLKVRNKRKGGNATRQNIQKQIVKVQKLHNTLTNIRDNYINQVVNEIVKTKPSYISIEDLNVSGMMKNKHLARVIAQQKFYQFKIKLQYKCKLNGIELRIVDRYYPSSKMCNECGSIDKTLNLSDRIYICKECGCVIDRDKNASINLANAKTYKVA